jgi:hypothetical protein
VLCGRQLAAPAPLPDDYRAEVQRRAALYVAARAQNVEDCRALLAMLGLLREG